MKKVCITRNYWIVLFFLLGMIAHSARCVAQIENEVLCLKDPISKKWGYASKIQNRKSPLKGIKKFAVSSLGKAGSAMISQTDAESIDWVIPPLYDAVASDFSEQLAGVEVGGLVGFIDIHNRFIIEPRFEPSDELSGFSMGLAAVKIGSKYGFVNKKGEVVIPPVYDYAENFNDKMLAPVKQDGKYGAIDLNGNLVVPFKFAMKAAMTTVPISNKPYRQACDSVDNEYKKGAYSICQQLKECSDEVGNRISDSLWIQPLKTNPTGEGSFKGIKDQYNRMIVPCRFSSVTYDETNHLYVVNDSSGRYGIYSHKGDCYFRPLFDNIGSFEYGQSVVSVEGIDGTIDNSGWINPIFMDDICNAGLKYDEEGNVAKATTLYNRILTIDPNHVMALNNLAIIDIDNKDYNKGMKKLKLAHKLAPDNELISNNLQIAKKNRNERRWNRINTGLEIAAVIVTLGAMTYSAVSGQSVSSSGLSTSGNTDYLGENTSDSFSGNNSGGSSSVGTKKCRFCAGSGNCSGNNRCRGSGQCKYCYGEKINSTAGHYYECGACHGTGKCSFCGGSGKCKHCGGSGIG